MAAGTQVSNYEGKDEYEGLLIRAIELEGRVVDRPGEWRSAAESLAAEAASAGHAEAEVVARRAAAWAARELYDHDAAKAHLARAQACARAHGLRRRLGEVLLTRSAVHLELGDVAAAGRVLRQAREAFAPHVPLELAFAEGLVAQKAGRANEAVASYRHVFDAAAAGQEEVRFKAANNLGELLTELGRLDEADEVLACAAELAEERSAVFAAIVAVNRAGLAVQRGRLATAEDLYARSEALARQAGMPLTEFRFEQVAAFRAAGLWAEAAARLDALVGQFDHPGTALLRAEALLLLAEATLRNGDAERAHAVAGDAFAAFAAQRRGADRAAAGVVAAEAALVLAGDPLMPSCAGRTALGRTSDTQVPLPAVGRTRALAALLEDRGERARAITAWLVVGRLAARSGRADAARTAWGRAARLASRGPLPLRMQGHLARALAAPTAQACRNSCATGLADLASHRAGMTSTELRARLAAHGRALAEVALTTLPRPCPPGMLFRWWEAGRSAAQLTSSWSPADDTRLAEDLAALRRASLPVGPGEHDAIDEGRRLLEQRRLEARVRRRAWTDVAPIAASTSEGRRAGDPTLVRVGDVARHLGDRALVSYGVLDGELVAVAVHRGRARRLALGPRAPVAEVGRALARATRHLTSPDASTAARAMAAAGTAISRLDAAVAAPVTAALPAGARPPEEVVIIPPAGLASVPWNALPAYSGCPVRLVSSARTWLATVGDAAVRSGPAAPAALVSTPELPGAEDEVGRIAARRPGATVLTGAAATVASVGSALQGVVLAHLSCHGTLRPDAPLFSALRLADGPFTVYDLERIAPPPEVVVLAACDAGLVAEPVEGPDAGESLGFVAVLLQRGTRAVVAATVPVPDLDTSSLMVSMHDRLLAGASTAAALHEAVAAVDASTPNALATALAFSCFGGG